ncbi:MAG: TetR/AcrR family transcriptional regulator [Phycisphaeraceae bacterium]|nr:TetR/AcrR family transcriptional regulator [Phycisphaeraceae bacterium]
MPTPSAHRRYNQRHRTRKDLLSAASRLLKQGKTPTIDDVAAEAMVSRATAYRYFPTIESLLVEAPIDDDAPDPFALFGDDESEDPVARVDKAEAALHDMSYRNERQLRLMLAASLQRSVSESRVVSPAIPLRQNRREPLIEAALVPVRWRLPLRTYRNLRAALSLVFGLESMIVFQDVLGLDAAEARRIKRWAIRALVRAAMEQAVDAHPEAPKRQGAGRGTRP